jgi:acetyltransferase
LPVDLDSIFKPKSIAVVGASTRPGTIGYVILNNILRYQYRGSLYAVNPKADFVNGVKSYGSVMDLPERVDLAIVVVPRDMVASALDECGRAGVPAAVTITAGFKEIGGPGIEKEQEIIGIIRRYGMRMVGPNCYGIINTEAEYGLNATFSKLNPLRGRVAFLSQSGALGEVVIDYTNRLNIGISMFVSIGNKADITDIDVLQYWENDPSTDVILLYIENIENSDEFMRVARRITAQKPIVAVKAGRTESGARAVSSHTGVLAGGDIGVDAFFEKCGIIRAGSFEELFDIAMALTGQPLPSGDRVAIITNAGGPAILQTDSVETLGLKMARFERRTVDYLRANLLPMAAVNNPIDVIASGGAEAYAAATRAALDDPNVDILIIIFVPPILVDHRAVIDAFIEEVRRHRGAKPVLCCLMGSPAGIAGSENLLAGNIPIYSFPDGAARAIAGMVKYARIRAMTEAPAPKFDVRRDLAEAIFETAKASGKRFILGPEAMAILEAYGVKVPGMAKARTEAELTAALPGLRPPYVMKTDDPDVVHKTEVGGVVLNIETSEAALAVFADMHRKFMRPDGTFRGVLIQEMAKGGVETIIGMNRDPSIGPLLMFGLGGISVEVMKDVAVRVVPLSHSDAEELVKSIKGYKLLAGYRGAPPVDMENLRQAILRLSQLASDFPQLESFDVNPFIAAPANCHSVAVDARFVLR